MMLNNVGVGAAPCSDLSYRVATEITRIERAAFFSRKTAGKNEEFCWLELYLSEVHQRVHPSQHPWFPGNPVAGFAANHNV